MKITEHIKSATNTLFSFEILPPLKGQDIKQIYAGIEPLMEFNPPFIDVTYHREEFIMKPVSDGTFRRITTRKRPGTVAICAAIMNKFKVDAVPHLICGGFNREETENALIDLHFLGIDNVLVLRGDNLKHETVFTPEPDGNANALELLLQVKEMNNGIYLDEDLVNPVATDFCIGVAGYPEKHQDAPNLKSDLQWLKKKVDAGAEFITTQMFFDNKAYFDFLEKCKKLNIDIPIIPGIKPIATKKQLTVLPKIFHIDIPEALSDAVEKAKDDKQVKEIGIEWAIQQCKELKAAGVPVLHFYTMGRSEATKAIAQQVF
ncbi:MAG: methylenetetrahydrofolate reductase [NAD(P)H] [Sphingobacteriaceae bacterium]|nr:methylenetetrahydrofolate reductase [NAD(P)H] [Sphingobacteriaceae bacterium]